MEMERGVELIHQKGTQTLETNRLILRQYRIEDAEDIYVNWATDREVTRFWGWEPHEHIEKTRMLLQGWISNYQRADNYHWVIEDKKQSEAIGYIYLNEFDESKSCATIHYLLSRRFWNQGIMTEACAGVLSFAFTEIGLEKVMSRHHEMNLPSGRVLEKCGFRFMYKEFKCFEDCPQLNGIYLFYEISSYTAL